MPCPMVWIRASLGTAHALHVASHEARHVWRQLNWTDEDDARLDTENAERDAAEYAVAFGRRNSIRPWDGSGPERPAESASGPVAQPQPPPGGEGEPGPFYPQLTALCRIVAILDATRPAGCRQPILRVTSWSARR
jgi:hypothetical protein